MKILVTGGAGFIGSNYVHYVFKHHPDYEIVVLDKLTYAADLTNLDGVEGRKFKLVVADILDEETVDRLVEECDAVVHFAAESHVDRSITGPKEFVMTNVVGTQVLLDACVKYDKRFHHISTDEVFGFLPLEGTEKFREDTLYAPSSPYAASKASSDHLVRSYHLTYGLRATISNSSNNYGPRQNVEKLIPLMITNALQDKKLPVYGNGLNVRDWLHVEDHCSAIDLILHKGKIGETYLVGGNEEWKNIDLVKQILCVMDKPQSLINFVTDRLGHDLKYAIDSTKIEKELGWKREFDFNEGLRETIRWYTNKHK